MSDQKIINGYADGHFCPNEVISRKHAAVLLSRAKGAHLPEGKVRSVKDIPKEDIF